MLFVVDSVCSVLLYHAMAVNVFVSLVITLQLLFTVTIVCDFRKQPIVPTRVDFWAVVHQFFVTPCI